MQSLVQRQFWSVVPGIVICLLTVGVVVDVLVSKKLEQEFDELLIAKSNGLIALTEDGEDGFEVEHYEVTLPNYTDIQAPDYFEFLTDSGDIVEKSLSLKSNTKLPAIHPAQPLRFLDIELPDGRAGRVLRTRFLPRIDFDNVTPDGGSIELDAQMLEFPGAATDANSIATISGLEAVKGAENFNRVALTLQLASSREKLDSLLRSIHFLFIAAGLLTTGLILYVLRRGTNRAMLPLNELAEQLADLDEHQLDKKLALNEPVAELNLLTDRFNILLDRLQDAFNREKRFTGDIAHELRTPVSEIRSLLDVHQQWPEDIELRQNFIQDVDTATERMHRTIENLLTLVRAENHSAKLTRCDDLSQLLTDRMSVLSGRALDRNIDFKVNLPSFLLPAAGYDQWVHIMDNVLCNAIDHGQSGSSIIVGFYRHAERGDHAVFEISNEVVDLEPSDLPVMFERLWQKDAARTSDRHGGLGLALVSMYAVQINAQIESALIDGRLVLKIVFPTIT